MLVIRSPKIPSNFYNALIASTIFLKFISLHLLLRHYNCFSETSNLLQTTRRTVI